MRGQQPHRARWHRVAAGRHRREGAALAVPRQARRYDRRCVDRHTRSVHVHDVARDRRNRLQHGFRAAGAEVHVWGTRARAADYDPAMGSDLTGLHYAQVDVADFGAIEAAAQRRQLGGVGAGALRLVQGGVHVAGHAPVLPLRRDGQRTGGLLRVRARRAEPGRARPGPARPRG